MTQHTFLAAAALGRALKSAGMADPPADPPDVQERRGAYFGSYTNFPELKKHLKLTHGMASPEAAREGRFEVDDARVMPGMKGFTGFDFLKLMNNMPTAHATLQAGARGPANTFIGHASSGMQAIARAWDGLRLGMAEQFVTGATGPGCIEGIVLSRCGQRSLAAAGLDPARAARPLDQDATGLVPGDGAAAFVLETREAAEARGARPLAVLRAARDAFAVPAGPRGPLRSAEPIASILRETLDAAGWAPTQLDYLAASGSGMPDLDRQEAQAIGAVLGRGNGGEACALAVHTGITGFCEAAHAPLGLLGALQAMQDGLLPPWTNLLRPFPGLEGFARISEGARRDVRRALVLCVSPEGSLATLAIERP
jgi:act minimal PKS chain-length factor (CLF/KS beta)